MDRYDSYKASGIEWVGEIPSHWNRLRLKHTVLCSGGSFIDGDWIEAKDISEEGIKYLTSGNVGVITYKEQGSGYITQDTFEKLGCLDVYAGDILISRLNEPISRACIVPELNSRIVTCVDNVIYRPDKSIFDYRFVVYTLNNRYYTEHANLIARGTTMHRISRTTLGGLSIPVPTLAEQQAIADWLDKKCGEIDRVIEKQSKRIELLEELKQSVITQAVTHGLNPNVALKKSGIEWIGEIPEHWEVAPLKRYMKFNNGQDYKEFQAEEGYPVMGSGGCFAYATKYLYDGEAVLLGRKGTIDKPLYVNEKFWSVDTMFYATPKKDTFVKFMYYVAKTIPFNRYSTATALPSMTQTDLGNHIVAIPPRIEQFNIATYLDTETAKIDAQIAKVNKEIELLQEYKQSIITEVVTGKRKVC